MQVGIFAVITNISPNKKGNGSRRPWAGLSDGPFNQKLMPKGNTLLAVDLAIRGY